MAASHDIPFGHDPADVLPVVGDDQPADFFLGEHLQGVSDDRFDVDREHIPTFGFQYILDSHGRPPKATDIILPNSLKNIKMDSKNSPRPP